MTLDELAAREGVRDTYARYTHAGDLGSLADLAQCFTLFQVDAADHGGRHRDELVPAADRWLFAHRLVSIDGIRPGSTA